MKKYLFFFSLFWGFGSNLWTLNMDNDYVLSFNDTNDEIREYINIDLEQEDIIEVDLTYIIPEYFEDKEFVIVSNLFKKLNDINVSNYDVIVRMDVINNSYFDYEYVNDSFVLSTPDLSNYDSLSDYKGFDNQKLSSKYIPYRSYNSAILNLFENEDVSLNDEDLNEALIRYGYKGIDDLDEYYLIFYNNKYGLNAGSLEEFPDYVIKEIFNDDISDTMESNDVLIKFAYYYWYNRIYSFVFEDEYNDYSIGCYLRNKITGNNYFKDNIGVVLKNEVKDLTSFRLKINKEYYSDSFKSFNYDAYLEFKMNRINYDDTVIPPKTGI